MAARTFEATRAVSDFSEWSKAAGLGPAPASRAAVVVPGHSGHDIHVHADYAVWCNTDSAFVNLDGTALKHPGL